MIYEKPELDELELQLEASFLAGDSNPIDKGEEQEGEDWD